MPPKKATASKKEVKKSERKNTSSSKPAGRTAAVADDSGSDLDLSSDHDDDVDEKMDESPAEDSPMASDDDDDDDDLEETAEKGNGKGRLRENFDTGADDDYNETEFDGHYGLVEDIVEGAERAGIRDGDEEAPDEAVRADVDQLLKIVEEVGEEVAIDQRITKPKVKQAVPRMEDDLEANFLDKKATYLFNASDDKTGGQQMWYYDTLVGMWRVRTDDVGINDARSLPHTKIIDKTIAKWKEEQEEARDQRIRERENRIQRRDVIAGVAPGRERGGPAAPRANIINLKDGKGKLSDEGGLPRSWVMLQKKDGFELLRDYQTVRNATGGQQPLPDTERRKAADKVLSYQKDTWNVRNRDFSRFGKVDLLATHDPSDPQVMRKRRAAQLQFACLGLQDVAQRPGVKEKIPQESVREVIENAGREHRKSKKKTEEL